jgi:hypothetical protein
MLPNIKPSRANVIGNHESGACVASRLVLQTHYHYPIVHASFVNFCPSLGPQSQTKDRLQPYPVEENQFK